MDMGGDGINEGAGFTLCNKTKSGGTAEGGGGGCFADINLNVIGLNRDVTGPG